MEHSAPPGTGGATGAERGDDTAGPPRRPTLAVIAAQAGVSQATVSKVVNGRTDVAKTTRDRIEQLLTSHDYQRRGARGDRRSGFIDLAIGGLDSPWAVEILRGVESESARHEVGTVVSRVRDDDARPPSWMPATAGRDSDGVILVTSRVGPHQLAQLEREGTPLVVVDPVDVPGPGVASVGATNWAGGLSATEHLVDLGHRRIGAIGGPRQMLCTQARIDGYRAALERAGLRADPSLVRYGDFGHGSGFHEARALLASDDAPTAIFAGSDQQALGTYEAARQARLTVPHDVSVVGFDDLPLCQWVSPPMTTVRQPLEEMGRVAARTLFELVDGGPLVSTRVELATELRLRLSTAEPPR